MTESYVPLNASSLDRGVGTPSRSKASATKSSESSNWCCTYLAWRWIWCWKFWIYPTFIAISWGKWWQTMGISVGLFYPNLQMNPNVFGSAIWDFFTFTSLGLISDMILPRIGTILLNQNITEKKDQQMRIDEILRDSYTIYSSLILICLVRPWSRTNSLRQKIRSRVISECPKKILHRGQKARFTCCRIFL